jgi:hypothetical protein
VKLRVVAWIVVAGVFVAAVRDAWQHAEHAYTTATATITTIAGNPVFWVVVSVTVLAVVKVRTVRSVSARRTREVQEQARAVAARSRDDSPAEVWARLSRTGWHAEIEAGRLAVLSRCPDPGTGGGVLSLVADPLGRLGPVRVLVATDPATGDEVALPVPADTVHPLQAAAWTYTDPAHPVNPSPEVYADLCVRT